MIVLKVPYAEKDEAKALGARWNPTRKCWYIPDGKDAAPFAKWVTAGAEAAAGPASPSSRDAFGAKPVVGSKYVELAHACNPFEECPECKPRLIESGWLEAHQAVRRLLAGL
ncbi:hypothetical protein G4G28_12695 [Massilia sp. Dwa41.01b]|uniref:DUF5710 domain-containing protein n=1 Tax=unclassified Massilia TaxID=2609279 RepID=UPI001602124B|nr:MULTISPECIES: DUF5710 domain-containing protein [unclassified Massilia]QNA89118.1 hypothetical protein G4G28_12695 [Massilia sp. Dwa41.01b]QNB00009.1 hypothetical protein G4G31_16270 [Massilia sp. Se16.2.3]